MNNRSKRLLVIAKDVRGSSTRYRAGQFAEPLQAGHWNLVILAVGKGQASRLRMLRAAMSADAVLVLRKTFDPLTTWLLRRASRRLIFDFDDAIFVASSGDQSPTRYRRFARLVRVCDQVWAGNPYLADAARKLNPNTELMPTVLDESKYGTSTASQPESGRVDLVWIGSRSTRKYLEKLVPVLNRIAAREPALGLRVIADFALPDLAMHQTQVDWMEHTEAMELAKGHIGIAPMIDNPWTRGKCGLKVLQYMATGLPVVTDAVGVNPRMVEHEVTGLVVATEQDWQAALLRLGNDRELRARLGGAGRARLESMGYTAHQQASRMLEQLRELVD